MRVLASLAAVVVAGLVAACSSGPAPTDRFYTLSIEDPGRRYGQPLLQGTVEVARFAGSGIVDQRPILYTEDGGPGLRQYSYHYWLEPPSLAVRDALISGLRLANAADRVVTPPARANAAYRVRGRLQQLVHTRDGAKSGVTVAMEIVVVPLDAGDPLLVERYKEHRRVGGPSVAAAVRGARDALTDIAGRFLDDLARAVRTG